MRNNIKMSLLSLGLLLVLQACNQQTKQGNAGTDSFVTGKAQFVADESFAPIVDEELYVFKGVYTDAKPVILYKSENDALRLLLNDSIRVAILSRELNPDEIKIMQKRTLPPVVNKFAIDAVTIIVNEASADTVITVSELKKMLNGQIKTDKNIVFDNPNSSLVRYLKDFSGNREFKQKNIYALKSNKEVIKYVSEHPNAIGLTGFSWLNDPDNDYAEALKKVKIVGVRNESAKQFQDMYFKPSQTTLSLKQYPLTRSLYIIDCTGKKGLGAGFANFLTSVRGQRVILKSGLLPSIMPERNININSDLKL